MSKKMMLLTMAAVGALAAMPAAGSAQEIHIDGVSSFTGVSGGGILLASGEPKIQCKGGGITGSFDSGSSTTGKITLDSTGCTAEFLGIKANCNTSGAESQTIASSGAFHLITVNSKPGILVTPVATTIICPGFSNTKVAGNIIGTLLSPACGASSTSFALAFTATGSTQDHLEYTGVKYDLTSQTGSGSAVTAGLNSAATLESTTSGTLTCT